MAGYAKGDRSRGLAEPDIMRIKTGDPATMNSTPSRNFITGLCEIGAANR